MLLNKILLVINILFLQSYLVRFHIGTYPSNLQEILIGMNTLAFLATTPLKAIFQALKKHWIILGLVALTVISLLTTQTINQPDLYRHLKFLFFAIILAFIFLETFKEGKERMAALKIMGFGALLFGVFSVIYNLLGFNVTHDNRLLGPLDAAVYLSYYFAPFFILFSIDFFEKKKKTSLIAAILMAALILGTRSMGTIGASAMILLIYFLKKNLNKKTLAIGTMAALIIAGTIFYSKILPTLQTNYSSLDERGEIWVTSWELLQNPKTMIFGLGLGQFQEHYAQTAASALGRPPLDYIVLQPHNIFLLFIFQFGILGLIFLIFIIYKTAKNLISSKNFNLATISSFILLYFFLHGLIDTPFFKNDLLFLFILLLETALTQPRNQIH